MKHLKIVALLLGSLLIANCGGAQQVKITETDTGLEYEQSAQGKFEAEKTKDGWKIKSDTKNQPFKLLDNITYENEND